MVSYACREALGYPEQDFFDFSDDGLVLPLPTDHLSSEIEFDPHREPPPLLPPLVNVMVVGAAMNAIDPPQLRTPGSSKLAERRSRCYAPLKKICTGTQLLTKKEMLFILERMIDHGLIDFSLDRALKRRKSELLDACPDLLELLSIPQVRSLIYRWHLEYEAKKTSK